MDSLASSSHHAQSSSTPRHYESSGVAREAKRPRKALKEEEERPVRGSEDRGESSVPSRPAKRKKKKHLAQADSSGQAAPSDGSAARPGAATARSEGKMSIDPIPLPPAGHLASTDPSATDGKDYTTSCGAVLTPTRASMVLQQFYQAHRDPIQYQPKFGYRSVPIDADPARSGIHDLQFCTASLPTAYGLSPGLSFAESDPRGLPSRKEAKRDASFRLVVKLIEAGEILPDLTPAPSALRATDFVTRMDELKEEAKLLGMPVAKERSRKLSPALTQRYASIHAAVKGLVPPPSDGSTSGGTKGVAAYPCMTVPPQWLALPPRSPQTRTWHAAVLTLSVEPPYDKPAGYFRSLCLLTTGEMPWTELQGNDRVLEVDVSHRAVMQDADTLVIARFIVQPAGQITLNPAEQEQIEAWTRLALRTTLNKAVSARAGTPWLLAPVRADFDPVSGGLTTERTAGSVLDLALLSAPLSSRVVGQDGPPLSKTTDGVLTTPAEFGKCFYLDSALDPSPDDDDSVRVRPVSTFETGGILAQIYLEAQSDPKFAAELHPLETLPCLHAIPASILRVLTVFPLFMTNLDDFFVAHALSLDLFGGQIDPQLGLQAISCPSSVGRPDYERMELFGDTILKLITSFWAFAAEKNGELRARTAAAGTGGGTCGKVDIHSLVSRGGHLSAKARNALRKSPDDFVEMSVSELHIQRHVLLSNASLRHKASTAGLPQYIRSKAPKIKRWLPWGWVLEPKTAGAVVHSREATSTQRLGDKVVADIVEALIAAAYLSGSELDTTARFTAAIRAIRALGTDLSGMCDWSDVVRALDCPSAPAHRAADASAPPGSAENWMRAFQPTASVWGHTFRNADHTRLVFSMSDDPAAEGRGARPRLKMLGDALLDYFLYERMYHLYPGETPHTLSLLRHARHSEAALSAFAVVSGLSARLTDVPVGEKDSIKVYVNAVQGARKRADKVLQDGQTKEAHEFWLQVAPRRLLASLPQLLIGAIFLDSLSPEEQQSKTNGQATGGARAPSKSTSKAHPRLNAIDNTRAVYAAHFLPFLDKYCAGPAELNMPPKQVWVEMKTKKGCVDSQILWDPKEVSAGTARVILHGNVLSEVSSDSQTVGVRQACVKALERIEKEGWETWCDCATVRKTATT